MNLLRVLNRRISSKKFDASAAQLFIYGIALLIMVGGIRKVTAMQPTELQLVFGILLVMILTMQAIIMGAIVGLRE